MGDLVDRSQSQRAILSIPLRFPSALNYFSHALTTPIHIPAPSLTSIHHHHKIPKKPPPFSYTITFTPASSKPTIHLPSSTSTSPAPPPFTHIQNTLTHTQFFLTNTSLSTRQKSAMHHSSSRSPPLPPLASAPPSTTIYIHARQISILTAEMKPTL